jgi:hypothetical protein
MLKNELQWVENSKFSVAKKKPTEFQIQIFGIPETHGRVFADTSGTTCFSAVFCFTSEIL